MSQLKKALISKKDPSNVCFKKENEVDEIVPNIWLGGLKISNNFNFLNRNNIRLVIRFIEYKKVKIISDSKIWVAKVNGHTHLIYRHGNITYFHFSLNDLDMCDKEMSSLFDLTNTLIDVSIKQKNGVLIHCKKGHHRSASVLVAYLNKFKNMAYEESQKLINDKRGCALRRFTCFHDHSKSYVNK